MKIMVYEAARTNGRTWRSRRRSTEWSCLSQTRCPHWRTPLWPPAASACPSWARGASTRPCWMPYHALGIRYLSTRTIGYDHIDLDHARSIGLRVCSASYAPNGVADFTVMMILMCLRHYKQALWRGQVNDFSLTGLQGREMKDLTIGIIGHRPDRRPGCPKSLRLRLPDSGL